MRQFLLGTPRTRCCSLRTGPAGKTIFEHPVRPGSLRRSFRLTTETIEVKEHKHFISPTSSFISFTVYAICCIALSTLTASKWSIVRRGVRDWSMWLRTLFELTRGLQDLSYCHLNLLPCQIIKPLEGVLNVRPPDQLLQICF